MMRDNQSGFTLVELAISLVVIGLLLGGILKGQELYANSGVNSAARQAQIFDAALVSFHDTYGALPGDITSPATRIPKCDSAPCSTPGDGTGIIGAVVAGPGNGIPAGDGTENRIAWSHLFAAGLVDGVSPGAPANPSDVWGLQYPKARMGMMGFQVVYYNTADPGGTTTNGHYLVLRAGRVSSATAVTDADRALTPEQAYNFDRKIDNGQPYSGKVVGVGDPVGARPTCVRVVSGNTVYMARDLKAPACNMLIKTQF